MHSRELTDKAVAIIEEDFALLEGVHELAEKLGVTDCHLIRAFKADTGISPGQRLISTRIEVAKLILRHRAYSIETVAQIVGYSGANYFCKVFRRATGMTPVSYRKLPGPETALSNRDQLLLETLDRFSHT